MKFIFVSGMSDEAHPGFIKWHVKHEQFAHYYDTYLRDGDFEAFANWIGHDWVLRAHMGTTEELIQLGAKPFVVWERCPLHLLWDYEKRVFFMTNPNIPNFYYECHPIYPGIFDIPYNNSSRRTRVLNSLYVSLLGTNFIPTAHFGNLDRFHAINVKVSKLLETGYASDRQSLYLCKLFFCPNVDILEMALVQFVESFIEQARLHRNTLYFIDCPELMDPRKKRRLLTDADE